MKLKTKKKLIFLFLTIGLFIIFSKPGLGFATPESSYWFPQQLLNWSPENDPSAPYNRSQIPLAERVTSYTVNDNAQKKAKVVALSALNKNTSGVPSQGGNNFYTNTFSYWQYVDLMVYWAGSSGEGIIVPPSADVIDAAHKNGVPILGNVFFPPTVYGGQKEWVDQMLEQRDDGSFPAGDKLLEVAEYYGFDGWFINQETTGGTKETADKMKAFLSYLQDEKRKDMHIMWYDSMIDDGEIDWQNSLTDRNKMFLQDDQQRVSDSMFLNFWWENQQASFEKSKEIGRSPYDLYTGIDVEANGFQTKVPWDGIFPAGKSPYTSLGIYRPDWAYNSSKTMEEFYQKEQNFWVGQAGDPSVTEKNGDWKGMAHYFVDKTPITDLPFVTNFNTGSGEFFAINGQKYSEESWNNRSLQDILPTWRWLVEGDPLHVQFDWANAYKGGSSLMISGNVKENGSSHIKLYKTKLKLEKDTQFSITYQTKKDNPNLKIGYSVDKEGEHFEFAPIHKKSKGKWVTETFKLKKFAGKELSSISLLIEGEESVEDYLMNVGEIKVYNNSDLAKKVKQPEGVKITNPSFKDGIFADVPVSWKKSDQDQISHYEIFRVLPDGQKKWVGSTPNHQYYLADLKRSGKETKTTLEIRAVGKGNLTSKSANAQFEWPPYPKPAAAFSSDKTIAAPGESIQFFNQSSEVTEEVEWDFEGGSPSTSTDNNPVVTYEKEGTYPVTLIAKNSAGEDILLQEAFITISEDANKISNVALQKSVEADGQCAPSEAASFALDGSLSSKWCALGDAPHWMKIDLGSPHQLVKFVVHHAEAGGEPSAFNSKAFKIEISNDGTTWREAVHVSANEQAISEHSIPMTAARYIRFWIDQPTQSGDQAARIFEFEAYGLPSS